MAWLAGLFGGGAGAGAAGAGGASAAGSAGGAGAGASGGGMMSNFGAVGSMFGGKGGSGGSGDSGATTFGIPDKGKEADTALREARGNMLNSLHPQQMSSSPMTAAPVQGLQKDSGLSENLNNVLNQPIDVQPNPQVARQNNPYGLSLFGDSDLNNPLKRGR